MLCIFEPRQIELINQKCQAKKEAMDGYVLKMDLTDLKEMVRLIERENYNKPKSPDSRQPGCPEEKVKAIEDAMRHFQMI